MGHTSAEISRRFHKTAVVNCSRRNTDQLFDEMLFFDMSRVGAEELHCIGKVGDEYGTRKLIIGPSQNEIP